jgi:hypothetical protein
VQPAARTHKRNTNAQRAASDAQARRHARSTGYNGMVAMIVARIRLAVMCVCVCVCVGVGVGVVGVCVVCVVCVRACVCACVRACVVACVRASARAGRQRTTTNRNASPISARCSALRTDGLCALAVLGYPGYSCMAAAEVRRGDAAARDRAGPRYRTVDAPHRYGHAAAPHAQIRARHM